MTAASDRAPARPKPGLIGWIERRPRQAFAAFLALHFAVWTALPSLLYLNLPLDLIEALTYGREWILGSDKLPPLPWWLVELAYRAFGVDVAYYVLAQVAVIITFVLVYATARPMVGATRALIAVLIIDGLHYFQYTAVKFNHDVIQLPFWALAGYSFHAALKRGSTGYWLLLGLAFGAALWAKYFVVVLAAPYALFVLLDRDARRKLATPGPWISLAAALVIAAPHLIWLIENNFVPFDYVNARAEAAHGWFDHLRHPVIFAGGQLGFLLPSLLIAAAFAWMPPWPLSWRKASAVWPPNSSADGLDRRIVTVIAWGPAAAMLGLIAITGRGAIAMWGYPLWIFLGLWLVLFVPRTLDTALVRQGIIAWGLVFTLTAAIFVLSYTAIPAISKRYRAEFFPGDKIATELTARFHTATGKPLRYVIGTMWDAGNVAHYSPDQPEVLIDGLPQRAPWIDLGKLRANGALLVWVFSDPNLIPAQLAAIAPSAEIGMPFTVPARSRYNEDIHVGWAILKPETR